MTGARTGSSLVAAVAAVLCACLLAACGGDDGASGPAASVRLPPVKAGEFGTRTARGANRWFPLKPGYQSVFLGAVNRGSRRLPHRRVYTITDASKVIDGVRTVIALDQDFDGGQIAEQALDYLAEDRKGNVWYLGSYTEAYEGGRFVNANDGWLARVKGGQAGIFMPAKPQVGMAPYAQEHAPGDDPTIARVVRSGVSKCAPFKCYRNVLVIEEGGSENKYFAPGVGAILTEPKSTSGEEETEKLINRARLRRQGVAELAAEALKLDHHAATTVPAVFGPSKPAKRLR
ncbi:MAG: hypothetical protein QOJ63_72 [Solirubrobacteraceae bacterium]|jgi:hypothetical protein|nr:hypothetical protein [Solirubrobacteraceae bacterium]